MNPKTVTQLPAAHAGKKPDEARRDLVSRLFPWVLLSFALVRVVNLCAVQLPFNGWDELAHMAAAIHTREYGRMPWPISPMPQTLKAFAEAHPHPTAGLGMLGGVNALPYPGGDPLCGAEPAQRVRMKLYEAQHGPLFYHLAAALPTDSSPAGLLKWADGVRLINAALLLGTLLLWRRILVRAVPKGGPFSWLPDGVMLLMVSFSYVFYNFARFANDALALFLGTLALELYTGWLKRRDPAWPGEAWRYGILGAVTGAAVLAKATTMILLPVIAGSLAWRWLRRATGRRAALAGFLACLGGFVLGCGAVSGAYHEQMLVRYGQITGMQEAVLNSAMGHGFTDLLQAASNTGFTLFRNPVLYNGTLHQAGWSNLVSPRWTDQGFRNWLTLSALALLAALWRKDARRLAGRTLSDSPELPLLLAAGVLALLYHAAQSVLCWGVPTTGPWYGMLFLPVLFSLLLAGPALWGRTTGACFVVFMASLCNYAYLDGTYGALLTQQTGTRDLFAALRIVGEHHAFLSYDLYTMFVIELALASVSVTLALREMLGGAQAGVRTVVFIPSPPETVGKLPASLAAGQALEQAAPAAPPPLG